MVVPRFVKWAINNEPIRVYGDGQQKRCFANVKDIVDATGREMDQGSVMRWFNETMWFPAVWATDHPSTFDRVTSNHTRDEGRLAGSTSTTSRSSPSI